MVEKEKEAEDCMKYLDVFLKCNKEKPFTRLFGGCETEERTYNRCVMREHFRKRDESIRKSTGFKKGVQSTQSV